MPRIAIAGAGAAGLSLAVHLVRAGIPDLELTLIDRDFAPRADRTWCYWDDESTLYPDMVRKEWTRIRVVGAQGEILEPLDGLTYRMADSAAYSRLALAELDAHPSVTRITADSPDLDHIPHERIYQSIRPLPRTGPWLKQHFLGMEVRADADVFDPETATIMDFRVDQRHGFAFMYVLPLNAREALVEHTLFTDELLPKDAYRTEILAYLDRGFPDIAFASIREEYGVIPMVARDWTPGDGRIRNIGGAAGLAKASTGYTFARIHRDSKAIVREITLGTPRPAPSSTFKSWMDALIIDLIRTEPDNAVDVFEHLFRVNGIGFMLRFLDERTTFGEDLRLMASVPRWWDFIRRIRL
jgi:lycopene beta-cyclase